MYLIIASYLIAKYQIFRPENDTDPGAQKKEGCPEVRPPDGHKLFHSQSVTRKVDNGYPMGVYLEYG
jgi:hypothetical protein